MSVNVSYGKKMQTTLLSNFGSALESECFMFPLLSIRCFVFVLLKSDSE